VLSDWEDWVTVRTEWLGGLSEMILWKYAYDFITELHSIDMHTWHTGIEVYFSHVVQYHIIHNFSHMLTDGHSDTFVLHGLFGKKMKHSIYFWKDLGKLFFSNLFIFLEISVNDLGFSLMYLKGRTIFRNHDLDEHFISELLIILFALRCYGLLVLDPTLVKARHCVQHKVKFVTYSVHGVGCTDTTLLHIVCRCWLLLLLCSMVAGFEDVSASLL